MSPRRIRLRRTKGWRKPADAVVVARPSRWGNPYLLADQGRDKAIELYRQYVAGRPELVADARSELAGKDLACWCPLDQACHADVLLEIANKEGS